MKNKKRIVKLILTICVVLFLICFFWYGNHHLVVTTYTYQNEKIDVSLNEYRIVQISDLHNAEFGRDNKQLLKKISELKPDMIVITGDIVDSNHTDIKTSISFVEQAVLISDVYYVTGNHEYWLTKNEQAELFHGIEQAGAVILNSESMDISVGESGFCLIGLDDNDLSNGTLDQLVSGTDGNRLSVVLAHEPQYLSIYAASGCDLVLSGHAHGGQFILPFAGAVIAPDQGFFPQYTSGKHREKDTTMYISRGLGNSIIPVRIWNEPEIVCIDFQK